MEARKATIKQLRQELESVQTERKKRSRELKVAKDELKRAKYENTVGACEITALTANNAELEARCDQFVRKASRVARPLLAEGYGEVLKALEEEEVSAAFHLREVVAKIGLLEEIKDGGLRRKMKSAV